MIAGRLLRCILLSTLLPLQVARAQFTGTAPTAAPGLNIRPTLTTDPAILFPPDQEMRLMAGDLLRVSIYGVVPAYLDTERVSLDGSIRLNLAGVVPMQGLSLKEAEAAISTRFEEEQTFHNAQVQVEVVEAPGHIATVIGAVKGSVPVVGRMRLYDVLARSGGLPANASTVITVQRTGVPQPIVVDIGNDAAHNSGGNIPIFSGDTITVGQVGYYYVVGAVTKPGPSPLSGAVPTTVLQALSSAGGTNFAAKPNDAQLIRFTGGQRTAIKVPLNKIIAGKAEDLPLQTDDILLVPSSAVKSAIRNGGISTAIAIALAYVTLTTKPVSGEQASPATAVSARKFRLAYVVSHPIQYQAGLLRSIAAQPDIDLLVIFCSDFSARRYQDAGFGEEVRWDVPLMDGYRSVVLPRIRETSSPSPTRPLAFGFFRTLRKGLDGKPFDALWVHGYASANALHAMLAARALGIPVMLRAESWLQDRSRSRVKLALKSTFFRVLRWLVDAVLPIGTRNAEYWAHYFGDDFPAFLMPYAVDNQYFAHKQAAAGPARAQLQQALGIEPGRPVILFASKLQERKHCDHLVAAYLQLRRDSDQQPAPYLLIVGDGEMRSALEQQVRDSGQDGIAFAGFQNQSELPRLFDLSTVFVLPSRHEAWGLITNEAMACGLPVIVTSDAGCAVDIVRNGENGFVYAVGDIAALHHALRATLQPGRAAAMGLRSRDLIAQWSYAEDVSGLRAALHCVTGRASRTRSAVSG